MTDTKTKPHGWVSPYAKENLADGQRVVIGPQVCKDDIPVCLVPPALLDWVEEVEKFFQDEMKWGMIEDPESVKKLLNKLKEVRG